MSLDSGVQIHYPVPPAGLSGNHRHSPACLPLAQRKHALQRPDQLLRPIPVGLVHHKDVGDLHEACLHGLYGIAGLRHQYHHHSVGHGCDIPIRLSHTHRLHQHHLLPGVVQCMDYRPQSGGDDAPTLSGSHAPDKHTSVQIVPLHADTIAKHGASGVRAGRVHGKDPH